MKTLNNIELSQFKRVSLYGFFYDSGKSSTLSVEKVSSSRRNLFFRIKFQIGESVRDVTRFIGICFRVARDKPIPYGTSQTSFSVVSRNFNLAAAWIWTFGGSNFHPTGKPRKQST
jgi:hypothetical protein